MSRYRPSSSYSHWIEKDRTWGGYRIGWTVDFYYSGSRLRYPRGFHRDMDYAGAVRFAKRWNLPLPEPETES